MEEENTPRSELGVPNEIMASEQLLVLLCNLGYLLAQTIVENALFGLNCKPLFTSYLASPHFAKFKGVREEEYTFCPFAGVNCPNSLVSFKIAIYFVLFNDGLSNAVPKYSSPASLARTLSCAEANGTVTAAAVKRWNWKRIFKKQTVKMKN